jgi:charged multivesicular body protein 1
MAKIMDKFEHQFQEMDVRTSVVEGSMTAATASGMPEDQIESLMTQIADENNLEVKKAFAQAEAPSAIGAPSTASRVADLNPQEEDELSRRLAALRS